MTEERLTRLLVVGGVILYLKVLDMAYQSASELWGYYGLVYDPPEGISWLIASCAISLIPSLWMPLQIQRPSQVAYWILYLLTVIPMAIIPFYTRPMPVEQLLLFQVAIVISFVTIGVIYLFPLSQTWHIRVSREIFWSGFIIVTMVLYLIVISTYGFSFKLHEFANVGDIRTEFKEEASEASRISSYALVWLGSVMNPLIISLGLIRRRLVLICGGIAGQVLLYALTAARSILLSPIVLVGVIACLAGVSRKPSRFGIYIVIGFSVLILACPVLDHLLGTSYFSSILTVRLLFVPAMLGGMYYEYYSEHSHVMMSNSFFGPLLFDHSEASPTSAIARFYLNSDLTNANAHIWASAFADFGFPGILFVTVILAILFYIYDSASQTTDLKLAAALLAIQGLTWTNVALQTSILTHGVALTWLLVMLFPSEPTRYLKTGLIPAIEINTETVSSVRT